MQAVEQQETISAIATSVGAGIGIVRLSGATALAVATKVFRSHRGKNLSEVGNYQAVYGHIADENGNVVDEAIALVMRSPHSYTVEDVVELQCHGGQAVLRRVLQLTYRAGARPAERGEFTKRAFLNGRLDLAQAQSVMDVVGARTDLSLQVAEARLSGRLSARIGAMREEILALIAHLEALIDFPEDDVEEITAPMVTEKITSLLRQTEGLLAAAPLGRILRDGLPVAIIGKPNVGKSSLLNMLAGEDRAIVTDTPGTTRDSIETTIELDGILLRLTDTAGIRETDEPIEKIGVARAKEQAEIAELIWAVFDGSRPLDEDDEKILSLARIKPTLVLINKSDLPPVLVKEEIVSRLPEAAVYEISAKNPNARRILTSALHAWVGLNPDFPSDIPLVAEETQEEQLRQIAARMRGALQAVAANLGWDFVTVDLRSAWEILGEISGETVPDEIIDQIFARFCIGK